MASLAKLLELLAPVERPLSELVASLPESLLVHERLHCPWSLKGTVMRVLHERLEGREVDLTDGIKVFDERGTAQVLPDPDGPSSTSTQRGVTSRNRASSPRSSGRSSRRFSPRRNLGSAHELKSQVQVDPWRRELLK